MSDIEPLFPPELEQAIFECAADSAPECIPDLLLVCLRVYHWIEPMQFRTITASRIRLALPSLALLQYDDSYDLPQDFPSRLAEALTPAVYHQPKSPDFLHRHVRNLFTDKTDISALLFSLCTGVTNLYFKAFVDDLKPSIFPLLFALKLRRLSMPLQLLVDNLPTPSHPFFCTITHFQAIGRGAPDTEATHWPEFLATHFPALTHVSFSLWNVSFPAVLSTIDGAGMQNLYTEVLRRCTTLQVLVHFFVRIGSIHVPDVRDIRAVGVKSEGFHESDWLEDIRGSTDVWTRAEIVIEERHLDPSWIRIRGTPSVDRV
ncbi:hypothetical protein R3P38DRAFT_2960606 [Favolaschia claudopus]|uniref:F-box domain-containing protein n=1 Tax=Favolaschia claudopus TaxID=2862362 RepID=A0AAW0B9A5_9AGAR